MLRVAVENIQSGMVLARPIAVPAEPARRLLDRDAEVPADLIPHLQQLGIEEIWVRCRDLDFLEELLVDDVGSHRRELYFQVRSNFERIMGQATVELDLTLFQESIAGLFDALQSVPNGDRLLGKIDAFDNYLMSHSTNVCYVAMLVGMKLRRYIAQEAEASWGSDGRDLRLLGLGCLLHDIGKMRISPEILNKPGKLTPEEFGLIKLHPVYGYEILKGQTPEVVADIALNHHQRWDGKGYPALPDARTGGYAPLAGKEISIFSRIAEIADIYDAATSKRCYSDAKPPVQVLHEMRTWCAGAFDPIVEQAFYEVIPAFPIGSQVTLSNGLEAVVVDFNPRHPVSPKVQCVRTPSGEHIDAPAREEIDLATCCDVEIASIGKHDVRPYLAAQRSRPLVELDPILR